ncbi:MAG: DUF5615 family PIN-like protein [Croceimicrobium sp.]
MIKIFRFENFRPLKPISLNLRKFDWKDLRSSDKEIWEYARDSDFLILSFDSDFSVFKHISGRNQTVALNEEISRMVPETVTFSIPLP